MVWLIPYNVVVPLALFLSLSLSHTHTHTVSNRATLAVLQCAKTNLRAGHSVLAVYESIVLTFAAGAAVAAGIQPPKKVVPMDAQIPRTRWEDVQDRTGRLMVESVGGLESMHPVLSGPSPVGSANARRQERPPTGSTLAVESVIRYRMSNDEKRSALSSGRKARQKRNCLTMSTCRPSVYLSRCDRHVDGYCCWCAAVARATVGACHCPFPRWRHDKVVARDGRSRRKLLALFYVVVVVVTWDLALASLPFVGPCRLTAVKRNEAELRTMLTFELWNEKF